MCLNGCRHGGADDLLRQALASVGRAEAKSQVPGDFMAYRAATDADEFPVVGWQ